MYAAAKHVFEHGKKIRKQCIGAEGVNGDMNIPSVAAQKAIDPAGFYHVIQTVPGELIDPTQQGAPHVVISIVSAVC